MGGHADSVAKSNCETDPTHLNLLFEVAPKLLIGEVRFKQILIMQEPRVKSSISMGILVEYSDTN